MTKTLQTIVPNPAGAAAIAAPGQAGQTTAKIQFNESKSIYLEFYRGIAALGVALSHYLAAKGIAGSEFSAVVFVEMFFPLSGFILAPQVIKVYHDHNALLTFYVRRWIRTIPLYMLGLLAMALITYNVGSSQFFRYMFFYNFLNEHYTENNFYPISWSLAAEEYYYILFPLFMTYFPGKNLLSKIVSFICIGFLLKVGFGFYYDQSFIRIGTLSRFDSIGIGFLCFLLKDQFRMSQIFLVGAAGIAATAFHYSHHTNASVILFMYMLNFAFGMLCATIYTSEKRSPCTNIPFRWLSNLIGSTSYAVYVVHLAVLAIAIKANIDLLPYLLIVILLSVSIHHYFERPLLKLRPQYKSGSTP